MKKERFFKSFKLLKSTIAVTLFFVLLAFTPSNINDEWTLLASDQGLNAYAMENKCGPSDLYLFKFENTTDHSISLEYTVTAKLDPSFGPITKNLELKPRQVIVGTCENSSDYSLPNHNAGKGELKSRVEISLLLNR